MCFKAVSLAVLFIGAAGNISVDTDAGFRKVSHG